MINVHAWGGLAGQLSALSTCIWILEKSRRKPRYVFHEGGVTRRALAVGPLLDGIPYRVAVEPYQFDESGEVGPPPTMAARLRLKARREATAAGRALGIVRGTEGIEESTLNHLPLHVLSVHGYPKDWTIMSSTRQAMADRISRAGMPNFLEDGAREDTVAVHWRVGDYLASPSAFSSHGVVSVGDLGAALDRLRHDLPVRIFSDSPRLVRDIIKPFPLLSRRTEVVAEPDMWTSLFLMTRCRFFIGTNSGISMWAALAIDGMGGQSLLPSRQMRDPLSTPTQTNHLNQAQLYDCTFA